MEPMEYMIVKEAHEDYRPHLLTSLCTGFLETLYAFKHPALTPEEMEAKNAVMLHLLRIHGLKKMAEEVSYDIWEPLRLELQDHLQELSYSDLRAVHTAARLHKESLDPQKDEPELIFEMRSV